MKLSDKYCIVNWNINGWFSNSNPDYLEFKKDVLNYINPSVILLTETHCFDNQVISIDNYLVFQQNRKVINANARRGSGGVAIAISELIMREHIILGVYKGNVDGLLGIKLQNKQNSFKLGIIANYLPPDSFHYGQDPDGYFNDLASMWQDFCDCDLRLGGGDLNARTKQLEDFIPEIDGNLPKRTNPDNFRNSHGDSFITFLKDNRSIILNGRVTPHLNNYTFVSTRGSSVPDYLYCPTEQLEFCTEVRVSLMSEMVNLVGLIPPKNLPDHSMLIGKFKASLFYEAEELVSANPNSSTPQNPKNCQKPAKTPKGQETLR